MRCLSRCDPLGMCCFSGLTELQRGNFLISTAVKRHHSVYGFGGVAPLRNRLDPEGGPQEAQGGGEGP